MHIRQQNHFSQQGNAPLYLRECGRTYADFSFRDTTLLSQYLRVGFVMEGEGFITVDGFSYDVKEGDTYIIPPSVHYYYDSQPKNPMNKLWLHYDGTLVEPLLRFFGLQSKVLLFKTSASFDIMDRIHKTCLTHNDVHSLQSETNVLLFQLLELLANSLYTLRPPENKIEAVQKYIDVNPSQNITAKTLAEISGQSVDHTLRLFKQKYGVTPHQYLLHRKIELAKFYLQVTDYGIEQIASELSFCDGTHFSRTFFQKTKQKPSTYKRQSF